jgi:4-carboxymuconolactone decarboxylase
VEAIAKRLGLSDEDVLSITKGPSATGWNAFDAALFRAADELHRDQFITDATWNVLDERYDDRRCSTQSSWWGSTR